MRGSKKTKLRLSALQHELLTHVHQCFTSDEEIAIITEETLRVLYDMALTDAAYRHSKFTGDRGSRRDLLNSLTITSIACGLRIFKNFLYPLPRELHAHPDHTLNQLSILRTRTQDLRIVNAETDHSRTLRVDMIKYTQLHPDNPDYIQDTPLPETLQLRIPHEINNFVTEHFAPRDSFTELYDYITKLEECRGIDIRGQRGSGVAPLLRLALEEGARFILFEYPTGNDLRWSAFFTGTKLLFDITEPHLFDPKITWIE